MPNHVYTQEEKDRLHDLYIKLRGLEPIASALYNCQQDLRDELITDLADGDIILDRLDSDIELQIDFVAAEARRLVNYLHAAEIGSDY